MAPHEQPEARGRPQQLQAPPPHQHARPAGLAAASALPERNEDGGGPQQPHHHPQLEPLEQTQEEDIGELLLSRLLAGGRKRGADFDWSSGSSPSSPASLAGTPRKGGNPPSRRSAGGRLQTAATPPRGPQQEPAAKGGGELAGEGSGLGLEPEEDDLVVESFWESPVFVSMVQELLAWPLGVTYSAVVLIVCTWVHLSNLALWRLGKLLRRLGYLWRWLRPASAAAASGASSPLGGLSLPDRLARNASIQVIKSGLYWCGPNNTMVKDASVGAAFGGGDPNSPGAECAYFVPGRPSVIYVHGYQPRTIIRRFRESLNWADNDKDYGIDVNAADHWIKSGWNVGVFYWNQYADEPFIHDAEAKIWTNQTSVGMRYRKLSHCGTHVQTRYVFLPHIPCVAQQLANALQRRFPAGAAPYRLVGHSLGSQVVLRAATLMAEAKRAGGSKAAGAGAGTGAGTLFVLPTRIALLDPFFTLTPKAYLGWRTLPSVLTEAMEALHRDEQVVFETYKTSVLSHAAANTLRPHSAYFEIGQILCMDDFGAHIEQLSELSHEAAEARDSFLKMARASDDHLRMLMEASVVDDLWALFTSYLASSS